MSDKRKEILAAKATIEDGVITEISFMWPADLNVSSRLLAELNTWFGQLLLSARAPKAAEEPLIVSPHGVLPPGFLRGPGEN